MASNPPYDFMNPQEAERESFWSNQVFTLFGGLLCGLLANLLVRAFSNRNEPSMGNSVASSASKIVTDLSTNNKLVMVVRTDLGMTKGKVAAQCAHAAVECYRRAAKENPTHLRQWEVFGQAKVALKAQGQGRQELEELKRNARALGLTAAIIRDAGRTQVEAGDATVLGVGPGPVEVVDQVTGHLKLY